MFSLDAWIGLLLMTGVLALAFSPRLCARVNGLKAFEVVGKASTRVVSKGYWLLFALALLVGVSVRAWRMPELPLGLNQDGAMAGVEAYSLLKTGADQYGTSWPVFFEAWRGAQMSVLYSYFAIPFIWLFDLSRFSLRLPMVVLSVLALPVCWDFARRMRGRNFALAVLWMVALCPWQIIQSRWALEADMYPHMLLFSMYLLYLGTSKKPFLYLGMVFAGLTMYSYGIALYTVPFLLIYLCIYLLRRRYIRWWEALLCVGVYLLVAGPFLVTMAINFFGWKTIRLGPFTLQYFPVTERANDIVFFGDRPFFQLAENLRYLLLSTVSQALFSDYEVYYLSGTLYPVSIPAVLLGIGLLWWHRRRRRERALQDAAERRWDAGATLLLAWLGFAILCGMFTNNSNVNRANAMFYPLVFCAGYAVCEAVRRVRAFLPVMALLYGLSFLVLCNGYFGSAAYQKRVGEMFQDGFVEAAEAVSYMDCDRYYFDASNGGTLYTTAKAMFAHKLDGQQRTNVYPVRNGYGEEMDFYEFCYFYIEDWETPLDPTECAAYVVHRDNIYRFDPEEFLIEPYGLLYYTAYPRYWAED